MPPQLIVNADDLGISHATNLAIERAFREGIVTSASLMANMAAFEHAVEHVAADNPDLGLGAHLCLTSGRPVLPPRDVPLLVDARGLFRHGFFGLARLLHSRRSAAALDQVARELRAQVERIDACGIAVDHVNGHQHVHMLPDVFPIAAQLARQRGAALRIPVADRHAPRPTLAHRLSCLVCGGTLKTAILRTLTHAARRRCVDFPTAARCLGVAESGWLTLAVLRRLLSCVPPGVTEIFSHPGLTAAGHADAVCSAADRRFLASPQRAAELQALVDRDLRAALAGQGVALVRFRDALPPPAAAPSRHGRLDRPCQRQRSPESTRSDQQTVAADPPAH